ncbi:MAG: hypothetical protein EOS76_11820 [Mesorhizobium sp.]|uniref:hypothetical protein n=1 Tax=unclassified Mesorhizobium TaxID=325217 RepID=UPI000F759686|nr:MULTISPECIES: hypothetical protein [unclassified Mesorhizobium]AZO35490.1 hypothetical protein EJ072_14200 [Mesorhizobium sp. M2A.F.Ca.ET.046.03.2.1]RVC81507.1 hypothetical protein EN766_03125 [Mesorhizobium sp. M2A.F.Ca.ET.046.02.1.1]RWB45845.1 MAG: hypothetical protein EOQ44_10680 [Mesorhizobium sp.]RWE19481.1 MAG: hypothetical protein EOS76_11820 [Mesorhizobium sp.]
MAVTFEALNRLREKVRESHHDFRVGTEIFPTLDVERVARDLSLEDTGRRRGRENQPSKSSKTLDDVENTIVERIEAEKKAAHQTLEDNLQLFAGRLGNLNFEEQFGLIRQTNASSVSNFKAAVTVGVDKLHGLRDALNEAKREHTWFKEKHGLVRAARVTEGTAHYLRITLLLFLFGGETAGNAAFLAKGNAQGYFGGLIEAALFSLVNIGVALLVAIYLARLVTHRSWFVKFWGSVSIVAYLAAAFLINLVLAHYREVSGTWIEGAGVVAYRHMRDNPFGLNDVSSWLLFCVGFIFSLIAFIDGCYVRDPYPGFAGVEKRLRDRRDEYVSEKEDLIEELKSVRDQHNEGIEEVIKGLGARRREYLAIMEHRSRLLSLFAQHQDHLERAANQLLSKYREANIHERKDPAPKHFSTSFKLERIKPRVALNDEWTDKELAASVRQAQEELSEQIKAIGIECENGIEKYRELDNLFPDEVNGKAIP